MLQPMLDPDLAVEPMRRLLRVEYDKLVDLGVFEDERVELLRGVLVTMSPQGDPHVDMTAWLGRRLTLALGEAFLVRQHSPFAASEDSEPEPDLLVIRDVDRRGSHPTTALLLIEVSDSSLRKDRRVKTPIYAESKVPEYWIIDVDGRAVEVLTDPRDGVYQSSRRLTRGEVLRPTQLPGIEIPVSDLPWQ
jgi:Uma2 family endonuclease